MAFLPTSSTPCRPSLQTWPTPRAADRVSMLSSDVASGTRRCATSSMDRALTSSGCIGGCISGTLGMRMANGEAALPLPTCAGVDEPAADSGKPWDQISPGSSLSPGGPDRNVSLHSSAPACSALTCCCSCSRTDRCEYLANSAVLML